MSDENKKTTSDQDKPLEVKPGGKEPGTRTIRKLAKPDKKRIGDRQQI